MPLAYPDTPERYCLYLIDEYESDYAPDYDMGPRGANEEVGEFKSLAFMEN